MKKTVLSSVLTVLCIITLAQVPESFNYQAVVRDESNNPITNQSVSFRMSILKGSSSGESQYSELHSTNTGDLGIVNLVIGNGTDKTGSIAAIDWGADIYYLKVEIDKTGGTSYVEMGTTQLLSVPYALYAGTSTKTEALENDLQKLKLSILAGGLVEDIDRNIYYTVKIGDQTWMAENLKTTKYRNGDLIGTTTPATLNIWGESSPKYQWAYNGNESNADTYGRLYTWYAVTDSRNVCPTGWHVPSDGEWTTLTDYLGGLSEAGGKLKETGTLHWVSPNTGATNETGFTGLPGGNRHPIDAFNYIGNIGDWWSATEYDSGNALSRMLYHDSSSANWDIPSKKTGLSVRCIKD